LDAKNMCSFFGCVKNFVTTSFFAISPAAADEPSSSPHTETFPFHHFKAVIRFFWFKGVLIYFLSM